MITLLKENLNFNQANIIAESIEEEGIKNLYMKGTFIQGGVRNHNQRVYPIHEITNAVNQVMQSIRHGESVLGEADHPEELTINLDRVSHIITDMWIDGSNGSGKLKIIPTPMGNIVRTLIESGVKLGVSSRGSGNVDEAGYVSEFEIVTVDIVAKPSAPDAYPRAVFETMNWRRGHRIGYLAEEMKYDPKAQDELRKHLLNWVEKLDLSRYSVEIKSNG